MLFPGLTLILAGFIFLWLENRFYQYVDDAGRLHESLFLPLGVFSVMLGLIIVLLWTGLKVIHILKSRR
ncbi:hypothetical protein GZ77_13500 [Endozoicomonas montiporae]|uniref:DUF3955 domain-containing protein n=1 Tax=Endozoicomonas montiporae TaxID=1027273 RepID=A0A081N4M7_9GAMM|nr:hypothetical protein GZ77_13500 [Endozoicomonas montiporae]